MSNFLAIVTVTAALRRLLQTAASQAVDDTSGVPGKGTTRP